MALATVEISANIARTTSIIKQAFAKTKFSKLPMLVAVSKLKSKEDITDAYNAGQRVFGENYVSQPRHIVSDNDQLLNACPEIKWHFIGSIQSNKCNKLAKVPNLAMIETISELKIAQQLNGMFEKEQKTMPILIQVNTSQETEKSGIQPDALIQFYNDLVSNCKNLRIVGLMTIGRYGYDPSAGPNPDFIKLVQCRKELSEFLNVQPETFDLSMGMSTDFEHAVIYSQLFMLKLPLQIELGATIVRVVDDQTSKLPLGKDGKPLKPCCACPETRKLRDACILDFGEEHPSCIDLIAAHKKCLRDLGFKI
ncbi:hypothetical protein Ciccas_005766 [Cichlidogyrus casuarinus]|uniref:Pyridoxal phosphate homeostasis protein n=1 Tax=Cichlidogyrus casuarinus TaxID=1844966 RepID=A0ABD2Q800_9PLAT